jgi:hypothetical protein
MGGHRTISVFVAFAAMAAEEVNGTFKVTFPLIDINGIEQPLLYSCLYLQDSSSSPLEKHFLPTDHIFGFSAGNKTSLPSGNDGRCLDPHDEVPSVKLSNKEKRSEKKKPRKKK